MENTKKEINIFKPYLKPSNLYVGGKSRKDVEKGGKKIYKLSSNENPIGASPKAIQAIRDNLDAIHEYPDNTSLRLHYALENFYKGKLKFNQFITGNSGSEVLEFIIRAFLDKDLEYIVSNPMFSPYRMFSDKMGAKQVNIPLGEPDYHLNVEAILEAINDNTRLIFLTSPNNPTGTYIPKDILDKLIYNVPDHVVVVLDEVYYLFADTKNYSTALPYVLEGKKVIGLNSFSKSFGLAGLRMGYAYSTPEIAEYVQRLYKPFIHSKLSMEAAIAALSDEEFLNEVLSLVKKERPYIFQKLDQLGVKYWKSQSNFFMIKPDMPEKEFEEKILEHGVMVRPVTGFGAPGCVRITIGTREANDAFLNGLEKFWHRKNLIFNY